LRGGRSVFNQSQGTPKLCKKETKQNVEKEREENEKERWARSTPPSPPSFISSSKTKQATSQDYTHTCIHTQRGNNHHRQKAKPNAAATKSGKKKKREKRD
jgi:hypothetical protein